MVKSQLKSWLSCLITETSLHILQAISKSMVKMISIELNVFVYNP